jgi:hypothetical protein
MQHLTALFVEVNASHTRVKASKGQFVGYVCVSSLDQSDNWQLDDLELDKTLLKEVIGKRSEATADQSDAGFCT